MRKDRIRKKLLLASVGILTSSALAVVLLNPTPTQALAEWHRIGNGNLDVMKTTNGWLLYPSPTTYVVGLKDSAGKEFSKGKEFKMGSKVAYKMDLLDVQALAPQQVPVTENVLSVGPDNVSFVKVNGHAFLSNQDETKRIATGEIVMEVSDQSNLWLVSDDGATARPLLSGTGYEALKQKVLDDNRNKGEDKLYLVWAYNPHPVNGGKQIAYSSNKQSIPLGKDDYSVYVVNSDGSNERVLIDAQQFGGVRIVGTAKDTVVAHSPKNKSIVVGNVLDGETKEFIINGWPEALSPEGTQLFFRKIEGNYIKQNDLWVLNLTTGVESKVTGMPAGYFYNAAGEWSPDGTRYAFYANGLNNISDKKMYRDNNLLVVVDTSTMTIKSYGKPPGTANIYPLGSIHWLDNTKILTYLDDNSSWIADVSK